MNIFQYIYCLPLSKITLLIFAVVVAWTLGFKIIPKKVWKILNITALTVSVLAIFYLTVLNREIGSVHQFVLNPLWAFQEAKTEKEYYRSMYMNFFVFVPIGLSMPFALSEKVKHRILLTVLFALLLSALLESLQYFLSMGLAETNDIMCNTLGTAFGTLSYIIGIVLQNKKI